MEGELRQLRQLPQPRPKIDAKAALKMLLEALRDIGDKFKGDYLVNVLTGKTTAR